MQFVWRWRREVLLMVAALVFTLSEAITVGSTYRKQHQQPVQHFGVPTNGARWHHHHQHPHRGGVGPVTRVHRSGTSPNHYHQTAIAGARYRGPVKRVYLPYKYLPPQFQHKIRYSLPGPGGPIHGKRQTINAPPPAWKLKRNPYMGSPVYAQNSYMPPRKSKHPAKYVPNAGKLSQNSITGSILTDSYGAPYKVTSTTYGVPHPTQGAPEPPISNTDTSTKEAPTSFVQVYHGNNREVETKTSYSFNTQHHLPATSSNSHKSHHQLLASQQQTITRPIKTKANQVVSSSPLNYHLESNEHPVYRPTNNSNTKNKIHHKLSTKDSQTSSNYGGFQPPKQTYGFQPYDEKESSAIVGIGTSGSSDSYYSSNSGVTSSQTASTASLSPSQSPSATHLAREEYLSPNYFQQKS